MTRQLRQAVDLSQSTPLPVHAALHAWARIGMDAQARMGTQETNTAANEVDGVIASTFSIAEKAAEAAIFADYPFLAAPVLKQITCALVQYVGQKFSVALQGVGTFVVIDHQVSQEKSKMSAALAALVQAEKGGNPDEIKKAIQAYADAQSALVHDDGSATPR